MAVGDVTVQIINVDAATINAAMTALRVTANDKWLMTSTANGMQVVLAHIEEA